MKVHSSILKHGQTIPSLEIVQPVDPTRKCDSIEGYRGLKGLSATYLCEKNGNLLIKIRNVLRASKLFKSEPIDNMRWVTKFSQRIGDNSLGFNNVKCSD